MKEAVRVLNRMLAELKLEKHPDKTFIGKIDKGFDFLLGYNFSPAELSVATETLMTFVERATWLYEQKPGEDSSPGLSCTFGDG